MEQRPGSNEYGDSHGKYISLVPEQGDLATVFREQTQRILELLADLNDEQASYRYASGKWSIKEIVGHLTDNERIMSYRLLRIARGDDTPLPGYEENDYVVSGRFERFTISELLEQYRQVRESTIALLTTLPDEAWTRIGITGGVPISARAQACMMIGHDIHHMNVIKERYLNLVNAGTDND